MSPASYRTAPPRVGFRYFRASNGRTQTERGDVRPNYGALSGAVEPKLYCGAGAESSGVPGTTGAPLGGARVGLEVCTGIPCGDAGWVGDTCIGAP